MTAGGVAAPPPGGPGPPPDEALLAAAEQVQPRAHAPYSGFRVGAAVRTASGNVYAGCNVENASYGLTMCAERAATFTAVAHEGPSCRLVAVAVFTEATSSAPCGACRQVLAELGDPDVTFMADGRYVTVPLHDLLPHRFSLGDGPR